MPADGGEAPETVMLASGGSKAMTLGRCGVRSPDPIWIGEEGESEWGGEWGVRVSVGVGWPIGHGGEGAAWAGLVGGLVGQLGRLAREGGDLSFY